MAGGIWAGFGEQFSKSYEQRKKTMDRLVEENLDNARAAKSNYAKRKGQADQVLKAAEAIRSKFGLEESETLALVEAYGIDLPKLQLTLDQEDSKLKSSLGVGYTAQDVMSFTNTAQELNMPEGMTLVDGVNRLMGLNASELAREADPKSEGSKVRSFIRSALAFDPQLQAEEAMQNIKGPGGLSYAQLLEMQEAGFAPQDVYGDVTRAGGVTYDYTPTTAKTTRNDYSRRLSTKLYNADLTNEISFSSYTASSGKDKGALKAGVTATGDALSRLEREIVLTFRGTDMAMDAFRKSVLDDIYDRVDNEAELGTLVESIRSGNAIALIEAKGGKLTEEDIDAIISGEVKEGEAPTDNIEEATPAPAAEPKPEAASSVETEADRMLEELGAEPDTTATAEEDEPMVPDTGAAATAQRNQEAIDAFQEAASKVTYAEYEAMSKDERREAGLPVRGIDSAAAFGVVNPKQYFKGAATQIDVAGVTEDTVDENTLAEAATNVYTAMEDEFPDMTVLEGEAGKQIIRDFLEQNNLPINEGMIKLIQMQLPITEG